MLSLTHENVIGLGMKCCHETILMPEQHFRVSKETGNWLDQVLYTGENNIIADSVLYRYVFDKQLIWEHMGDIVALLRQLPETCRHDYPLSRGAYFHRAKQNIEGDVWGTFPDADMLLALGLSLNAVRWLLPRHLWACFPGKDPLFCTFV